MPELPEVETVRRGLSAILRGRKVTAVEVLRPDSVGYPEPRQFARQLPGHTFEDVRRRGKYLLMQLDGGALLVVHLRMSGRLLACPAGRPASPHLRLRFRLDDGKELRFEDMRVFGRLWYVPAGEAVERIVPGLATLGVEPLEAFTGMHLAAGFANRVRPVKSVLLDQQVVAGLGNIYADESLFQARIHPLRSAGALKPRELERLAASIRAVLTQAIELGGSTLRDYTDSQGVNGNYQHQAWVYGREKEPCRVCGTAIERVKLSGRSTHFCRRCQRQ